MFIEAEGFPRRFLSPPAQIRRKRRILKHRYAAPAAAKARLETFRRAFQKFGSPSPDRHCDLDCLAHLRINEENPERRQVFQTYPSCTQLGKTRILDEVTVGVGPI
jgi:hypothetical protein